MAVETSPEAITAVADDFGHIVHRVPAALEHRLTPPVLTDYLELTVGGTLSAGGIGGTSHRHGPQVDHVRELEVVTGTGEIVTCSPASNTAVFSGALAGYGQAGIITRATIPLIP